MPMAIPNRWRRVARRTVGMLLMILALVTAAIVINLIGIRLVGDVAGWQRWQQEHASYFFVWRLFVYALTLRAWWWMRKRVLQRDPSPEATHRLRRAEVAGVAAAILLESVAWLQHG